MFFNLKGALIFGLRASTEASPVTVPGSVAIEGRAKGKKVQDYMCGTTLVGKDDIGLALGNGRASADFREGGNNGNPGAFRVFYKKDGQKDFVGVMYEKLSKFYLCAPAPDPKGDSEQPQVPEVPNPPTSPTPPTPSTPHGPLAPPAAGKV
ncbi:hypothetical protein JX265_003711 [Neoarthrinium moseri]|uniref:Uncharacterized protein n=1 Tax=Neoarthrinium moseri TaxID=1658444 RepID=A0A9P9WSI6_9PEZI|nr:uncharacterized protein JN550_002456 [Neoarthrinium moseri]KAI1875027.1 hypothetical protein JN550_002456 [Neoarthrinium moseri]KAI1877703.1 hypothetical protein JX265_003711 [Neoarthrinium moseri]